MNTGNDDDFKAFLEGLKAIPQEKLENLLQYFPDRVISDLLTVRFFLIRCTNQKMREDDFIGFLLNSIVKYVLKYEEYRPSSSDSNYILENIHDIWKNARRKFLTKNKNAGEVGELILFLLLESRGIIQLLNKMNLKMANEMPVHGLDAIHIQADNNLAIFHFGQAKMYKSLNAAIKSSLEDVKTYVTNEDKLKDELKLVSNYIDTEKFDRYVNLIKDLINPYSSKRDQYSEMNSIFLGYDWEVLTNLSAVGSIDLTSSLKEKYEKLHDDISTNIQTKIASMDKIKNQIFSFYLLPFGDIEAFRNKFLEELKK